MDKIRRIAKAHYEAGSDRTKDLAHEFFDAMDEDGDGQVDIDEFTDFMAAEGHEGMDDPGFFDILDRDNSGTLDFWEVMTLYYIMKSGRPFCGSCNEFLTDVYFACVECYESPDGSYCLCLRCYSSFNWDHCHNRRPRFLDNYTLLEAKRIRDMNQARPTPMRRTQTSNAVVRYPSGHNPNYAPPRSSSSNVIIYNNHAPPHSSSSNAIVPAYANNNNFSLRRAAFKTFETALNIANLGVGLSFCSIM